MPARFLSEHVEGLATLSSVSVRRREERFYACAPRLSTKICTFFQKNLLPINCVEKWAWEHAFSQYKCATVIEIKRPIPRKSWRPVPKRPCSRSRTASMTQISGPEAARGFSTGAWPFSRNPASSKPSSGKRKYGAGHKLPNLSLAQPEHWPRAGAPSMEQLFFCSAPIPESLAALHSRLHSRMLKTCLASPGAALDPVPGPAPWPGPDRPRCSGAVHPRS